jgi:hypothetical protein
VLGSKVEPDGHWIGEWHVPVVGSKNEFDGHSGDSHKPVVGSYAKPEVHDENPHSNVPET